MKTVFNSSEIAHVWAKQTQEVGKTPNRSIFFDGPKIYSYGYHFCMANVVKPKVVFITDRRYSVTTSAHLSSVRYAVNYYDSVTVPLPDKDLQENAECWISYIKDELEILSNPRKKPETKEKAQNTLRVLGSNIDRYLEITEQSLTKKWLSNDADRKEFILYYNAAKSNQGSVELSEKLNKLAIANKKAETKKQKDLLDRWLKGERHINANASEKVYLRSIVNEYSDSSKQIESSKGARVDYKSGKLLFNMIQSGKDVIGHDIDGYTVLGLNGVLTIGCHKIEREEIERFAKVEGWIKI